MRVYKIISSKGDMRIVEAETQTEAVKLFEENMDENHKRLLDLSLPLLLLCGILAYGASARLISPIASPIASTC